MTCRCRIKAPPETLLERWSTRSGEMTDDEKCTVIASLPVGDAALH